LVEDGLPFGIAFLLVIQLIKGELSLTKSCRNKISVFVYERNGLKGGTYAAHFGVSSGYCGSLVGRH